MSFFKPDYSTNPIISVCIPLYDTEPYLAQCLRSVFRQDFPSFEVVIVSDASQGRDKKGRAAKKIVRLMQKESNAWRKEHKLPLVKLNFIANKENRGLIEVRRTLMYQSKGFYMTQVDSDDEMAEGALSTLYSASGHSEENSGLDIIHGTSTAGTFDENGNFTPSEANRYGKILYEKIEGKGILRKWIIDGAFTANTWGKLIKRELWKKAYENIPYTECNMADDFLLFFFIGQYASSYEGIKSKVYLYRDNTGMTSKRTIDSLRKWKMICSTASVFSVISTWISENPGFLKDDELESIRARTRIYLINNIKQMRERVVPELMEAAREMLCDYWGKSFVEKMESVLDEKNLK
ncbi:MAG: glycosyltransferase family 2 protein [Treponema sp.]|nr:glycosyltransferase family 2 protein [Treponema sp.]